MTREQNDLRWMRLDDAKVAKLGPEVTAAAAEITRLVSGVSLPRAGAT